MFQRKTIFWCFLTLLCAASGFAQSQPASPAPADAEKAQQEREKKAWALLDEIIAEGQALKLPENRIHLQATASDLLWPQDETRARASFQEATEILVQLINSLVSEDPIFQSRVSICNQFRQQMLQIVAHRDPELALGFIRATRRPRVMGQTSRASETDALLEIRVASTLINSDPKRALQITEESIEKGIAGNVTEIISQLYNKYPEAAVKLAGKVVNKLKSGEVANDYETRHLIGNFLNMMMRSDMPDSRFRPSDPWKFNEQDKKEFVTAIVAAVTDEEGYRLVPMLQNVLPLVEKYAPTQASAFRQKAAKAYSPVSPYDKTREEFFQLREKGAIEQMLEFAKKAAPEIRNDLYEQVAQQAVGQGKPERAKEIIGNYVPVNRRRGMLEAIDRHIVFQAANQGNVEEARRSLHKLQTTGQKVGLLTQLSEALLNKGDRQAAMNVLDEAYKLLSNQVKNQEQFGSLLQIARSYERLDPARSLEICDPLVAQLNPLIAAAEVIDSFQNSFEFQNGEMRILFGSGIVSSLSRSFAEVLTTVASSDLQRAQAITGRFERSEPRLIARLQFVQKVLRDEAITRRKNNQDKR